MPIQILRTLGDVLYSRHGLRAECLHCGWGSMMDLETLVRVQQRGQWTVSRLQKALACKICRRKEPEVMVTFVSPLH